MKENTAAIHTQVPVEVAAFLLNEKRAEVIKIETRFKVNVLMVPNKHLETPHYKLERLRHDDPRLDDPKASYAMAEEASKELESDTILSRREADIKPRQEAAVKGVTPSQPAPPSTPRPERKSTAKEESSGGLIGFIKRLFGAKEETKETEKRASQGRDRHGRDRNGRGRNRNRNRQEGGERSERNETRAAKGENRNEAKTETKERDNRQPRKERQPRNNKPEANQTAAAEGVPVPDIDCRRDLMAFRAGAGKPRPAHEHGRKEGGFAAAQAHRADDPVLPAGAIRRDFGTSGDPRYGDARHVAERAGQRNQISWMSRSCSAAAAAICG